MANISEVVIGLLLGTFLVTALVFVADQGNDAYGVVPNETYTEFYDLVESNRTESFEFSQNLEKTLSDSSGTSVIEGTLQVLSVGATAVIKAPLTLLKTFMTLLSRGLILIGVEDFIFETIIGLLILVVVFAVIKGLTGRGGSI